MIKKVLTVFFVLVIMILPAYALDLSDYPDMFLDEARIVVGKGASTEDVIGAIDIAVSIQQVMGKDKRIQRAIYDTDVDDLTAQNTIVVGGPCINSMAAMLMKYPKNCLEGFEVGKAIIRLYEHENGKVAMVVAGTTGTDTRRASLVLSNYADYELAGKEQVTLNTQTFDILITN